MSGTLNNAGLFLVTTLFDLYLFVLCSRLLLAFVRADYFNPITRFIIKLTNPIILKLRRIFPNYRNLETSTLLFILFLGTIKFLIVSLLFDTMPNATTLFFLVILGALKMMISIFFYAILFHAILSWIQPGFSPISQVLSQLSSPILRPLQRTIPLIAGFDLAPLFALIILQFVMILL